MATGREAWRHRTVENVCSNEKYKGGACLQKCYAPPVFFSYYLGKVLKSRGKGTKKCQKENG